MPASGYAKFPIVDYCYNSFSQEEKDKLYELIDKVNPCVAMGSKETIERFKEWTEGQVKTFEIPDNDNFLMEVRMQDVIVMI